MEFQLSSRVAALLGPELHALAWLLTYSLHAAVWALAAALLSKWQPLSAAARHRAWQAALLAPFVTTLLTFAIAAAQPSERAATSPGPHVTVVGLRDPSARDAQPLDGAASNLKIAEGSARRLAGALDLVAVAVLGTAGSGLLRFGASALEIRRRLRGRRKLERGPLFQALKRARARCALTRITLSESAEVASPLVLGRSEICIPSTGLSDLSAAQVEAVFAHELAHLERGDGIWFPIVGLVEAVLWLHPVARWACAQVRQSAELACDARCVEWTGEPRALALALLHIASRAAAAKHAIPLPTMARPGSGLVARVTELTRLPGHGSAAPGHGRARSILGMALVAVISVGLNLRVAKADASAERRSEPAVISKLNREMSALAARELALEAELRGLSPSSTRRALELDGSLRALEIEQELRHTREMQRWLEEQLVNQ